MKKLVLAFGILFNVQVNCQYLFQETFDSLSNWTPIGPVGQSNWMLSNFGFASGEPPELRLNSTPLFNGFNRIISTPIGNNMPGEFILYFSHFYDWFINPLPSIGIAMTQDQGATSNVIWEYQPTTNKSIENIYVRFAVQNSGPFQIVLFADGNSYNFDSWYIDDIDVEICLGCLTTPTNLTAKLNTENKVNLIWQDNSGELGFEIFRDGADTNNIGSLIATVPLNTTSYTDSTVQLDSIYSYRVRAIYGPAWSNFSNAAIVEIIIPIELASFTSLINENAVTLNWQTETETNNQGFEIERKEVLSPQSSVSKEEWNVLGFVNGNGTTTEPQSYSFVDRNLEAGKYNYRLKQIDFDGTFEYSNVIEVEIAVPLQFSLEQNYPNPFNPSTSIQYAIASKQFVTLKVYDVLGKEIATLVNEEKPAGNYEVKFDASKLASGIYYYQLRAGEFVETKKMTLLK